MNLTPPCPRSNLPALAAWLLIAAAGAWSSCLHAGDPPRPNILWLTAEDMSLHLGSYGDPYVTTPHLDAFAKTAVRYTHAFATAPVCSPARSTLITGMYATSLGTQRLRSQFPVPAHVRAVSALLREAGYYCSNRVKTDHNLADEPRFIADAWDESSNTALAYAAPRRALEELYDTRNDPHQLLNLAAAPVHQGTLDRMRSALHQWQLESRDLGFLAEPQVWDRPRNVPTPLALARDDVLYPLPRLLDAASLVGRLDALQRQVELLADPDDGVRYWAVMGLQAAGPAMVPARGVLRARLKDDAPVVRIEAANALAHLDDTEDALNALAEVLASRQPELTLHAARALELLGSRADPLRSIMEETLNWARAGEETSDILMFIRFSLEAALE